jgi:hypothetical protein
MADATNAPKILTIRIIQEGGQRFVSAEFGISTMRREIPKDKTLFRIAAILESEGGLDLEITTEND